MAQQPEQLLCNTSIDYSQIIGNKILPFIIELDLQASILNPSPGQNQRFCYKVTGVGLDNSDFADLSHLVLGICDQIPQNQIVNITVTINGVSQTVVFGSGGNVELRTPQQPDPPTGCPGLKFNFGLNKVTGVMLFCFELTTPHEIGPNVVCLFGGNTTANQLSICGPVCGAPVPTPCETTAFQTATVCVPVTVTPFAIAGTPTTFCCGDAIITQGPATCKGTVNGSCTFTITQNICISIPVLFGATATVGAPSVECGTASDVDICTNCNSDEAPTPAVEPSNISDNTNITKQKPFIYNCAPCKGNIKK